MGRIEMIQPEHYLSRSQDFQETWHDVGQFDWGTKEAWVNEKPLFAKG